MVILKKLANEDDLTQNIQQKYFQLVCLNKSNKPKDEFWKFLERDEKQLLCPRCYNFE